MSEISVAEFSVEQIAKWKEAVQQRHSQLFGKRWRNNPPVIALRSREHEMSFQMVLGWYGESGEDFVRIRERDLLDTHSSLAQNDTGEPEAEQDDS